MNKNNFSNIRSKIDCRWANGTPLVRRHHQSQRQQQQPQRQQQRLRQELFRNNRRSNSADSVPVQPPRQWIDYRTVLAQRQLAALREGNNAQGREIVEEMEFFLRAALTTIEAISSQRDGGTAGQLEDVLDFIQNKINEIKEKLCEEERSETGNGL